MTGASPRAETATNDHRMLAYIGTYTGAKSKGIYVSRFDDTRGELTAPELAVEVKNPTFLAIRPSKPFLYSAGELEHFEGKRAGAVSAFAIDSKTGKLRLLNQRPSGGTGACHVSLDRTGQCLMVANYGSGSIASFPILRDGQIGEAKSVVQHHGSSVNKGRQQGPHAHFIATDPSDRFAFCADLGLDKVLIYKLDPAAATLTQNDPPFYTSAPGSGPRHLAFHPDALHAFLITEMASTLTLLDYDSLRGSLKEVQTISTLPPDYKGPEWGAEVAVHPNGKFVYCSNRAQDAIALFEFDAAADSIKRVENVSTEGKTPRHFVISPSGKWLIAENQESASIITYRIDQKTGRLTKNGPLVAIDSPVCVALFR